MANFRMYPGSYVKFVKDLGPIKSGTELQVINVRYFITFFGINGIFNHQEVARSVEPMFPDESWRPPKAAMNWFRW